jgi:hypothetical protein
METFLLMVFENFCYGSWIFNGYFFTLNIVLKPYMRQINSELTPWLNDGKYNKVATE